MKIIEIKRQANGQEVAYLWDAQRGRILKMPVEDYTPDSEGRAPGFEEDIPAPRRQTRERVLTIDDIPDDLPLVNMPKRQQFVPGAKRKTIVPPSIASTMRDPNIPGSGEGDITMG